MTTDLVRFAVVAVDLFAQAHNDRKTSCVQLICNVLQIAKCPSVDSNILCRLGPRLADRPDGS